MRQTVSQARSRLTLRPAEGTSECAGACAQRLGHQGPRHRACLVQELMQHEGNDDVRLHGQVLAAIQLRKHLRTSEGSTAASIAKQPIRQETTVRMLCFECSN